MNMGKWRRGCLAGLCAIAIALLPTMGLTQNQVTATPLDADLYRAIERFVLRFDEGRAQMSHPASSASMEERTRVFVEYLGNLQLFTLVPQQERACLSSLLRPRSSEVTPESLAEPPRPASGQLSLQDPCYPMHGTTRLGPGGWSFETPDSTEEDLTKPAPMGRGEGGGFGGGAGRTGP